MTAEVDGYERWLREGLSDYLGLWQFVGEEQQRRGLAFEHRHDGEVRRAVIDSLRYMLAAGWIVLGDYTDERFLPLALGPDEVIDRVEHVWGSTPHFDMGIWFALTADGEAVARSLTI